MIRRSPCSPRWRSARVFDPGLRRRAELLGRTDTDRCTLGEGGLGSPAVAFAWRARSARAPCAPRVVLAVVALALVLAGCKVDATVSVVVRADGSGVVRVTVVADAEAVKAAESGGVALEQAVRLADLADSGWTVGSWAKADDGSATIVLSYRFESVDQVAGIVAGLNGKTGPLPSLQATRDAGVFSTEYAVKGSIDVPGASAGIADDAELVTKLGALGVDVNIIDQQLLAQIQSSFTLKVVVKLPDQAAVTFAPKIGKEAGSVQDVAPIDASSSVRNTERILFLGAAAGFAVLAILVWRRGRRRRRRGSRGGRGRSPAPQGRSSGAPTQRRGAAPARRVPPRAGPGGQTPPRG